MGYDLVACVGGATAGRPQPAGRQREIERDRER